MRGVRAVRPDAVEPRSRDSAALRRYRAGPDQDPAVLSIFDAYSSAQLGFLLASAFVAGLARGFSGFGAALIFVPLASAAVGPQLAAPVLLLVDGVSALGLLPGAWGKADRRDVGTMAAGALLGVPAGTWLLTRSDPLTLRWAIAGLIVALLVLLASGWRYRGRPATALTVAVGAVAGLFSGIAQVGGPPIVVYWLGGAIPAGTVRANLILYFFISTLLTAVTYLAGGLLTGAAVGLAVLTGPLYAVGIVLGSRLFGRADERLFRRICYALIGGAALLSLPVLDGLIR
jgi:hypothetical protein